MVTQTLTILKMEVIIQSLKSQGFHDDSVDIITSQWRSSTKKQLDSSWKTYSHWCRTYQEDPLEHSVTILVRFLTDKFKEGLSTSTLNGYKSSISTVLEIADPSLPRIGHHVIIRGLTKVFGERRPVVPRYDEIYDIRILMNHLIKWGPNDQLNLKRLQTKLLFLLILGTKFRFDDITKIDLSSVKLQEYSIEGYCIKPKQTGKGLPAGKKSITFKCQVESDDLDVLSCWKQYMGIASLFRLDGC